jgi:hypothetical protein
LCTDDWKNDEKKMARKDKCKEEILGVVGGGGVRRRIDLL